MKLVVHIGEIKTGSTSIQTALAAGTVPKTGLTLHYPCDSLNHNSLEPLFRAGATADAPRIKRIRRSITNNSAADISVISAERFSTIPPDSIERTLSNCFGDLVSEVSIIHYIRPHFGRAVSAYAEQVKIGSTDLSLPEFLDAAIQEKRYHSAHRIQKWKDVFGPAYSVRIMSRNTLVNQDVVADFFAATLGTIPSDWSSPSQVNASLCAEGTTYVRSLQSHLTGRLRALRHALGYEFEYLYNKATPTAKRTKLAIDRTKASEFYEAHVNDALEVDRILESDKFKNELDIDYSAALSRQDSQINLSNHDTARRIIADLLEIASCDDDRTLAVCIRNARFDRMIKEYKLAMSPC